MAKEVKGNCCGQCKDGPQKKVLQVTWDKANKLAIQGANLSGEDIVAAVAAGVKMLTDTFDVKLEEVMETVNKEYLVMEVLNGKAITDIREK